MRGFSADSKREIPRNFFFFLKNKPLIRGSAMEGTEEEKKQCKKHQVYMRACLHDIAFNHPLLQEVSYTVVQQNKKGQACFSENKQVSAIPLLFITADQRHKSEKILLGNCQHGVITRR